MDNKDLFTAALQLEYPWKVSNVEFIPDEDDPKEMTLHITIAFECGAKFVFYYEDGSAWTDSSGKPIEMTAHDTADRTWRHLNFFQYKTYIHAKMPKVSDGEGQCPTVRAPWARKNSGFTLLFEAWVMELAKHLPVSVVAKLVGVRDNCLWRFIKRYVDAARELEDYSEVDSIGMDETSKKGHNYVTVMVDLAGRKVIFTTEGKDHTTVGLSRKEAEPKLKKLCSWLIRSRLKPMKELCGLIRGHWDEILNYFEYRITNAILEGMNSIIQNIKRRARGFRNNEYFETIIYLNCSKLDIDAVIANA